MSYIDIKLLLKHLAKNKIFSSVTILGFAIALMFVFLLATYLKQEYSVDQFHTNKDRVFRLYREGGKCGFAYKIGGDLMEMLPEIENYTALFEQDKILKYNDKQIKIQYVLADSSFFNFFSFKLLEGNKKEVLKTTRSIVLSESYARKLFNGKPAVGQKVSLGDLDFIVSGIMQDIPANSHIKPCDAIINFRALADIWGYPRVLTSHDNNSFSLYFLAKKNTNLVAKTPEVLDYLKRNNWMYRDGRAKTVAFEPLTDIYFSDAHMHAAKQNSRVLLSVLIAIVIFILILSVINYTNLSIAQTGSRSKDIAMRKIMGGDKLHIFTSFIVESVLICLVSALLAILFSYLFLPFFNNLLETKIALFQDLSISSILYSFSFIAGIGIVSGLIPALIITSFNPIDVVKGSIRTLNSVSYSKPLVSFQFIVVIVLLVCSMLIKQQTTFMCNKDLGFSKDNILYFSNYIQANQKQAFVNEMKKIPGVKHVGFTRGTPISGGNNQSYIYNNIPISLQEFYFDTASINMMGLKLEPTGVAHNPKGVYINHAAIKKLNLKANPENFKYYKSQLPVLGVVNDFNTTSLHTKPGPVIIHQMKPESYAWDILIKISPNNMLETIKKIKKQYSDFTGGIPVEANFMDDTVNSWYKKEANTSKIILYFTILAIIISMMGILAMSIFYAQTRRKEIGIRKVNGAKTSEILAFLNTDFAKWVLVAFVVACPLSWYIMTKWLENYAYKIGISWWVFAIAGIFVSLLAVTTVSLQSWRAANRNPVEALRYE